MNTQPNMVSSSEKHSSSTRENFKHMLRNIQAQFPKFTHEHHSAIVDVNKVADEQMTFGQRVADAVASRMGSWNFIIGQALLMVVWIMLNVVGWFYHWDIYPFVLLNLAMSAQAAFATPLIMMSQNRQAEKDRLMAESDYKTNVKGEQEICHIMEHLDHQDGLILQIVQQLQAQNQYLEAQHKDILSQLSKLKPEIAE